jgi:hypothetical protein
MAGSIRRRTDLRGQNMGGELMLMDEKADKVHVLNATSAFIWQCLAETGDEQELQRRLQDKFAVPASVDLAALLGRALAQFREKNLLAP